VPPRETFYHLNQIYPGLTLCALVALRESLNPFHQAYPDPQDAGSAAKYRDVRKRPAFLIFFKINLLYAETDI
jgi:hypothetical protein